MKNLLFIVLLILSPTAFAEQYIVVNIKAWHTSSTLEYNEENWGLGYAWDTNWKYVGDVQPQVGFYRTSEYDVSSYAAYFSLTKYFWQTRDRTLQLGGTAGVAVGYASGFARPILAGVATLNAPLNGKPVAVNFLASVYHDENQYHNGDSKFKPLYAVQVAIPFKSF